MSNKKANAVLGVIVGIIAATAVLVGLKASQPIETIDKSKPEGVIQAYLQATIDRDFEQALDYFEPNSKCEVTDFDMAYVPAAFSANLLKVQDTSTGSSVSISIETQNGDPFGGAYSERQVFHLKKYGNDWRINGIPWPLYQCGSVVK